MGAPTKLTTERAAALLANIRLGHRSLESVAAMAGIAYQTLRNWIERGEKAHAAQAEGQPVPPDEQPFLEFLESYRRARAEAEGFYLATLRQAAQKGDTRAAMWWLERSNPAQWGARQQVDIEVGGEITVELEGW